MKKKYLILIIGILILPKNVLATSGWLSKNSITSCNGQTYGSHGDGHWHVAEQRDNRWYAIGDPLSGNPCQGANNYNSNSNNNNQNTNSNNNYSNNNVQEPIEDTRSSDTSIKEIKINDSAIEINNDMNYETKQEIAKIEITLNDEKATVEFEKEKKLEVGTNNYTFNVTAENGTTNNYTISIKRLAVSNNKDFEIFYKDKKLTINKIDKTIEKIDVDSKTKIVKFNYTLNDKNAKIEFTGNDNLKTGENKIKIIVTAEDGSQDTYTIIADKTDVIAEVLATIITICLIIACPIGLIIYFRKEKRDKQKLNKILYGDKS